MSRLALALWVSMALPVAAWGGVVFHEMEADFNAAVSALDYVGIEDFQGGVGGMCAIASPLCFGVPNVDNLGRGIVFVVGHKHISVGRSVFPDDY